MRECAREGKEGIRAEGLGESWNMYFGSFSKVKRSS